MVCFQTKNPNWENFAMEDDGIFYGHLVHFTVYCYILLTFGIVRGNFVYFYRFGILYQEKYGNSDAEALYASRVTRLGEFWPFGRLFNLGGMWKIKEIAHIFKLLFTTVKVVYLFWRKNGLGYYLGDFFTVPSGHLAGEEETILNDRNIWDSISRPIAPQAETIPLCTCSVDHDARSIQDQSDTKVCYVHEVNILWNEVKKN
jgi:hypothetical protein